MFEKRVQRLMEVVRFEAQDVLRVSAASVRRPVAMTRLQGSSLCRRDRDSRHAARHPHVLCDAEEHPALGVGDIGTVAGVVRAWDAQKATGARSIAGARVDL